MKRFVSALLAVAMLLSFCPMVLAEEAAAAIEAAQPDVTAEAAEQTAETAKPTETETPIEEETPALTVQAALTMPTADLTETTDEVAYRLDGAADWTSSTLAGAVTAIGKGTGTIKVLKDIAVSAEIKITGNVTLITDGKDVVIKRANTLTDAPVISVASGATLNLGTETAMENTLTIDGGAVWNGNDGHPNAEVSMSSDKSNNTGVKANWCLLKNDNGTLNMYDNVILQNNHFFPDINTEHCGAGVGNNGTFYMHGGKIWNCNSYSSGETGGAVANNGADKKITPPVAFYMYGGEICYNTAFVGGGVSVGSSNNQKNSAKFEMHGGSIHDNIGAGMMAHSGGGVYVNKISSFIMYGGKIIDNSVKYAMNSWDYIEAGGGGIDAHGAIEIKEGAYIANNSFESNGKPTKVYGSDIAHSPDDDTSATVSLPSKTTVDGVEYDVIWYQDGLLDSNNLVDVNSIYSESNQIKKTDFSDINVNYGLKAVYEEIHKSSVTVIDPIYMVATYPGGTDSKIGTITVTGASDLAAVSEGTELTLKIDIANDSKAKNHSFVKWVVKTESGTDVTVTDNKFTMPSEAVTVTAEYVPDIQMTFYAGPSADTTYECKNYTWNGDGTITYTMPGNKGTLTISTPNGFKLWQYIVDDETKTPTVTANDVVTVTVSTNEGYTFNGIKSVTSQMGNLNGIFNNSGTYTFSVPVGTFNNYKGTQNAYIILDITTKQYNITKNYNTDEGKVIVIDKFDSTHTSIDKAYYKENLWVSIEPKVNYKIKSVSCKAGENDVSDFAQASTTGKSYTFTMPASDVTINVEFELDACKLTIDPDIKNGSITTDPAAGDVAIGSEVTITATPSEFYELDTITVTKASGGAVTVTDNKFTMPDENVIVSATFKKKQFAVTTQTDGNGTITVINLTGGQSAWGEAVEYRVEANAHYDVASITVNGEAVTLNEIGIYSFTMSQKDATISATFKKHKYNITIEGDNITYTIPGAETFDWGESVTVTITPEQWYSITKVEASDSITVTDNGDGTYSFVMPSADVILTVTATRPTYTVKFDTKGGSTVIDPQVIANGESVVKPRAPEYLNRGFAGWYTSTDFKPENKYNFEQPVTGDITLYARWFLWGDVNGDGRADTTDAYIIQRCRVGLEKYTDMANRMAGFVSGLDKANPDTTDAYDIQRLRVGLITRFSVEDSARGYEFNLEEGTYTVPR